MEWDDDDFRVVLGSTKIDYDENKSAKNVDERGYSFELAVHYLTRLLLPIEQAPFITRVALVDHGETRHEHMTVAEDGEVVFFVTTMRDDETVRIISMHRASKKQRAVFKYYTGYTEE